MIIKNDFRDALLASLLDSVRASGNRDVHVTMIPTERGLRLGPLHLPVEEEAESLHVRFLQNPPPKRSFAECVRRFNANIPYSGLLYSVTQDVNIVNSMLMDRLMSLIKLKNLQGIFSENKEKIIIGALHALVQKEGDQKSINSIELESQFHALRRLVASKVGYAAFTTLPG